MAGKRADETQARITRLRRLTLAAIFADDSFLQSMALKGGGAMELVHGIATRASIDIEEIRHHNPDLFQPITTEDVELLRAMFSAKRVALELLRRVGDQDVLSFHERDWLRVKGAIPAGVATFPFGHYGQRVAELARQFAEAARVPDSPPG